jgi:hypothetical protein
MFYVSDGRANQIVVFEKLSWKSKWKALVLSGSTGALSDPAGLLIMPDGRLIIADRGNHRLVVFSKDHLSAVSHSSAGEGIGALKHPTAVALSSDESIYIADTGNRRIVRLNTLEVPAWTAFGSAGRAMNQFVEPTGVAIDTLGRIVIADPGAGRLIRMDNMQGDNWTELILPIAANTARPYSVNQCAEGLLITDAGNSRVLLLTQDANGVDEISVLVDGAIDRSILSPTHAVIVGELLYVADPAGASIAAFKFSLIPPAATLSRRLYGTPGAFSSPPFPRIGGFTVGART